MKIRLHAFELRDFFYQNEENIDAVVSRKSDNLGVLNKLWHRLKPYQFQFMQVKRRDLISFELTVVYTEATPHLRDLLESQSDKRKMTVTLIPVSEVNYMDGQIIFPLANTQVLITPITKGIADLKFFIPPIFQAGQLQREFAQHHLSGIIDLSLPLKIRHTEYIHDYLDEVANSVNIHRLNTILDAIY